MPRPSTLSLRALNRATLGRQLLLTRHALSPAAAIERLGGMQAQVPRPPFIGLWSRLSRFTRTDLIRAIERRDVVRSTMMRATIHLVSRRDFLAWRAALQPMLTRGLQSLFSRQVAEIDLVALLEAARARFETDPATFANLRSHLVERFPGVNERIMGYIVRMQLPLVQTPAPGAEWGFPANASFTMADGWLDAPLSADVSLAPLVRRYLSAFGPATARDFQTWSGVQGAKALFERMRQELIVLTTDEGHEVFDVPRSSYPDADTEAPVRFLPEYDNLLLAYADRRRVVDAAHRSHLISRNLIVPATILVDGMVAGTWKVVQEKKTTRLVVTPFKAITRADQRAMKDEGGRLLQFLAPEAPSRDVSIASKAGATGKP